MIAGFLISQMIRNDPKKSSTALIAAAGSWSQA
jgi:hypothetical protein